MRARRITGPVVEMLKYKQIQLDEEEFDVIIVIGFMPDMKWILTHRATDHRIRPTLALERELLGLAESSTVALGRWSGRPFTLYFAGQAFQSEPVLALAVRKPEQEPCTWTHEDTNFPKESI